MKLWKINIGIRRSNMFDVAIIGAGAAAVSASLTLKSLNKDIIVFGNLDLSEKIRKAEEIRNYPGLINVSGKKMQEVFLEQLNAMDIKITPKIVTGVYKMGNYYSILCNQDMYEAKSVIITTGVEFIKPIKGEEKFLGTGVSYCATCDGLLFKGKTIAIICTSKELEHEIEYLSNIASKVFVVPLYKGFEIKGSNIEVISGVPQEIVGNTKVEKVVFRNKEIIVDGVFMLKNAISAQVLVPGLIVEDDHIKVDRLQQTNLEGLFAAGDCTGRPYQYAKAIGEGNVAAHSATEYLSKNKK